MRPSALPMPEALQHGLDGVVEGEAPLEAQLGGHAHLGVDDAVVGQVLGALGRDPDDGVALLHHPDGVLEGLQVEHQVAAVRALGEPAGQLVDVGGGQAGRSRARRPARRPSRGAGPRRGGRAGGPSAPCGSARSVGRSSMAGLYRRTREARRPAARPPVSSPGSTSTGSGTGTARPRRPRPPRRGRADGDGPARCHTPVGGSSHGVRTAGRPTRDRPTGA